MEKIAVLFPGQGSQFLGMLTNLISLDNYVLPVIQDVKRKYGIDLLTIEKSMDTEVIMHPSISQPLILISSVGYYHYFKRKFNLEPDIFTGHSMGEISALVCSGQLDFQDALDFAIQRGRVIEENFTDDYEMVAIVGRGVKNYHKRPIGEISNNNDENQIVVTVIKNEYQLLEDSIGKQYIFKLGIRYPFHTQFMSKVTEELSSILENYNYHEVNTPVYSSTLLKHLKSRDDIIEALSLQVVKTVNWTAVTHYLKQINIRRYVEIGSGKVLKNIGLLNYIEIPYYSISDLNDVNLFTKDIYSIGNDINNDDENIFEFIKSLVKVCITARNISSSGSFVKSYKTLKIECENFTKLKILPTPKELDLLLDESERVLLMKGYTVDETNNKFLKEMIRHDVFDQSYLGEKFVAQMRKMI